jgi:predicted RNA binding protein YcfA (HicA-like mRNA interferase family)
MAGKFPSWNCRQLESRLKELGCQLIRTSGSHRHYSNPFRPDRLITFAWHSGDVPRGIVADVLDDLGMNRQDFYFKKVKKGTARQAEDKPEES